MFAFRSSRWSALAIAFGLMASAARAELITPNSIPNPPSSVGSANGTPVYTNNLITSQYKGTGLNFSAGAAITSLNGVNVWAPTQMLVAPDSGIAGWPPPKFPAAQISYYGTWSGASFVQPGTLKPAVATSLSIEIIGRQDVGIRVTYANSTVPVGIPAWIETASEPNGGILYTFPVGPGITSFSVFAPPVLDPPGVAHPAATVNPTWGVAEVSVTLDSAPEPSSLILAALGALGLATRGGWRRRRTAACPAHA
jgi:MYXO-CTERM domain-containing protein